MCIYFFRLDVVARFIDYSISVTFMCTGKPKHLCDLFFFLQYLLYCSGLKLNPQISKVCLTKNHTAQKCCLLRSLSEGHFLLLFSRSVVSGSLQPCGLQQARLFCLSLPPGVSLLGHLLSEEQGLREEMTFL